ncbi:cobalt-precorrin-6A reductase [Romeriopsis navalis]|nr:cobalt-precorrin-6A reductase [Romeriopsis navalis]
MTQRILILGGTGDAAKVIDRVATLPKVELIASLAGRTPKPNIPTVGRVRRGGFGGVAGLAQFLQTEKIDLVIDATHPFAAQISHNAAVAATQQGIPRLLLNRLGWQRRSDDCWIDVADQAAAAAVLPGLADRIFLTIGRQELKAFAHLDQLWFLMRMITPPDPPIPPGKVLLQQGPFSVEDEKALMQKYRVGAIVSKNSGGNATYAKIIAARELGLPVVMIPRPALPVGEVVHDVDAVVAWVERQLESRQAPRRDASV